MPDIEFDTDSQLNQFRSRQVLGQPTTSGMAGWLVRHKSISDESNAGGLLTAFVIFNFVVAGTIIYFFVLK